MLTLLVTLIIGVIIGAYFTSIIKAIADMIKAIVMFILKALFVFSAFIGIVYAMAFIL